MITYYQNIINNALPKYVKINNLKLKEAVTYSLLAPGKRLRPSLLMATYSSLTNKKLKHVLPFACALEMIHAYSLIHDDLPAMDDDGIRRGRPTNHIIFGEAVSILAGDMLLNLAYETMSNYCLHHLVEKNFKAMQIIANAAGNMVKGQTSDILTTTNDVNNKQLYYIHKNKTAALFSASVNAGAQLSGASEIMCRQLAKLGHYIGLAYQIKDDYQDITLTESETGKTNSDERNNKATYTSLFGKDKTLNDINVLKTKSLYIINSIGLQNSNLQKLFMNIFN